MKKNAILRLEIERMAYGADAIAHTHEGRTVFVSGGVPKDVVDVRITAEEPSYLRGCVDQVVTPSPDRVQPECPYADVCGGCPWAALSEDAQLLHKRSNVIDSLIHIGHFDQDQAEELVDTCERPSPAWGYRNKIELTTAPQNGRKVVGMHSKDDANTIAKVDRCPLLSSKHEKLVSSVSGALNYLGGSWDLGIKRVGIRCSSRTRDVEVALWTKSGSFPRARVAKVLSDATRATSIVRVMTKGPVKARKISGVEVLKGKGFWRERVGGESMLISAPSFFQVNTKGADRLVELVLDGLAPTEDDEAMDLYCGAGTFTLPLARRANWVSAVEAAGPAVRDLRRNLDQARIDNADPIGGDAFREFPDTNPDIIVVDPPRSGLAHDVVRMLSEQPARAIAYVSCDPATLARDLERFADEGTFRPVRLTPIDLFPQTFHCETVTILRRAR